MTLFLSQFFLRLLPYKVASVASYPRIGRAGRLLGGEASTNAHGYEPVTNIKGGSAEETQPQSNMSSNPMASYTDFALFRIKTFFDHYRPPFKDLEWAEKKKAEVAAEIERREQEDQEGAS